MQFQPIKITNETAQMVDQFEQAILTGQLTIGERLPNERDLAQQLQIGRASVNRGLQELSRLGFVTVKPRQGNFIANYNETGNLETLNVIINFKGGTYRPSLLRSIFATRRLFEDDMIAHCDDPVALPAVSRALARVKTAETVDEQSQKIFDFYHQLAIASGNAVTPLLILHFKSIYLTLGRWLLQSGYGAELTQRMAGMVTALLAGEREEARQQNDALIDFCLANLLPA